MGRDLDGLLVKREILIDKISGEEPVVASDYDSDMGMEDIYSLLEFELSQITNEIQEIYFDLNIENINNIGQQFILVTTDYKVNESTDKNPVAEAYMTTQEDLLKPNDKTIPFHDLLKTYDKGDTKIDISSVSLLKGQIDILTFDTVEELTKAYEDFKAENETVITYDEKIVSKINKIYTEGKTKTKNTTPSTNQSKPTTKK